MRAEKSDQAHECCGGVLSLILHTPRLTLRHATPDDLDAVHAIMADARVLRYWSTPPHENLDETREWLNSMIVRNKQGSSDFLIEHKGQVIGKMGAYELPDFGFYLAHDAQGKGFAREAMTAFVAHVFDGVSDYLTADVDPRNGPSLNLLKGAGFTETGREERTWLVGDEWCDSVYFRLDKPVR